MYTINYKNNLYIFSIKIKFYFSLILQLITINGFYIFSINAQFNPSLWQEND